MSGNLYDKDEFFVREYTPGGKREPQVDIYRLPEGSNTYIPVSDVSEFYKPGLDDNGFQLPPVVPKSGLSKETAGDFISVDDAASMNIISLKEYVNKNGLDAFRPEWHATLQEISDYRTKSARRP